MNDEVNDKDIRKDYVVRLEPVQFTCKERKFHGRFMTPQETMKHYYGWTFDEFLLTSYLDYKPVETVLKSFDNFKTNIKGLPHVRKKKDRKHCH